MRQQGATIWPSPRSLGPCIATLASVRETSVPTYGTPDGQANAATHKPDSGRSAASVEHEPARVWVRRGLVASNRSTVGRRALGALRAQSASARAFALPGAS